MFGLLATYTLSWFDQVIAVLLVLPFIALGRLAIALPIAVIRELRRPDDENIPDWMGDARGRKRRLTIVLMIFLVLAVWFSVFLVFSA
jgi:hypothetical protein